jgi:hypothetical protein
MHKLSILRGDVEQEHSYPAVFRIETTRNGTERIVVGVPGGDPVVFERLGRCLEGPYWLLFVLHTPRGEGEPGRYQSPEIEPERFNAFLARYGAFLSGDGRHDFWLRSPSSEATIVWDRHNLIYAYGPLDDYISALRGLGFSEAEVSIPFPHAHNYRPEFDSDAKTLLLEFEWTRTPLKPEDEQ